ncbi:hypothetical protein CKAH01_00878 [Colletotrichum kahawae]|uniref:Uncharacterized protein n=1 Tax=Colletotrichum kahawae TaxID=34407 RepID=A0AAD9YI17_COLKA|nr:hypothetical protein CKAH01_00878 [Colletotrichum kahawae]
MVVSVVLVVLGDDAVQSASLILRDGGTNRRREKKLLGRRSRVRVEESRLQAGGFLCWQWNPGDWG